MNWKRIKCVVEVPVRGNFTEKDLAWAVRRAMEADGFWQDRKYLPKGTRPIFGRVETKEYSRVMRAQHARID